ncbi:uncharacterized protein N7482_008037 [Penicillium canariense]|uniref:Uncharacterized protein n=1 Tax=Penicillium canariense TaxID=189055 RepID=A0A9W9HUW7_9EURO|nr:uncharacterized protein N7482_008037 [Penicillium canariense]KAJ5156937.1 hypothetical protein N7482_008037 [Penicillium canariense]
MLDSCAADEILDLEPVRTAEELKPFEEKLLGILNDLLQPDPKLEASAAAKNIDELFPSNDNTPTGPVDENDTAEDPETFLWSLWGLIIQVMRLVPPNHPGQTRMIAFMESLGQITSGTLNVWGSDQELWSDFPILRPCLRDHLEYIGEPDPDGIAEWINQNSFMARLLGKDLLNWDTLVIWMMRDALEEEPPQEQIVLDCYIAVVVQWITHAGETIFSQLSDQDLSEQQKRVTKGGSLYHGKDGLCPERWEFWRQRAGEVSKLVSKDLQPIALAAAERMSQIERAQKA